MYFGIKLPLLPSAFQFPNSCPSPASMGKGGKTHGSQRRHKRRKATAGGSDIGHTWVRKKVRVQGLFGRRHWVLPRDVGALQSSVEGLRQQFRGCPKRGARKKYEKEMVRLLATQYGGRFPDVEGLPEQEEIPSPKELKAAASPRRHSSESAASVPAQEEGKRPASGGLTRNQLHQRLEHAFKQSEKVELRQPSHAATASYKKEGTIAYMHPPSALQASQVRWLPQEAADWLYQALHAVLPLLQFLLGTSAAFNSEGKYLRADGGPASGGQLVAFGGTELGSRRDRALIAYDTDCDLEAFVTPCCDFAEVWRVATPYFESLDLMCRVTVKGEYYRIAPKCPLTFCNWKEWCHEAREDGGPQGRASIATRAKAKQTNGVPPQHPIGPHFIDIGVKVVQPEAHLVDCGGNIKLAPRKLFPIVEGFFGPLRIPLPRTPAFLDAAYHRRWRTNYAIKSTNGKYRLQLPARCRCAIHPSVPLKGDPTYLGCFEGAGCESHPEDIVWRWFATPVE